MDNLKGIITFNENLKWDINLYANFVILLLRKEGTNFNKKSRLLMSNLCLWNFMFVYKF